MPTAKPLGTARPEWRQGWTQLGFRNYQNHNHFVEPGLVGTPPDSIYNNRPVRIGRRLVLVLLFAMTPVVAVYTYWTARWSSRNYIADLKRETRATTRALAPVVAGYIQRGQWTQVHQMLQRMSADGTDGAVLQSNGNLWYAVAEFPRGLTAAAMHGLWNPVSELPRSLTATVVSRDNGTGGPGFDFEQSIGENYWFCRIVPLSNSSRVIGYLVVAQDWTDIDEDVRERMLPPVGAALLVTALIALLIPILVSRYVSRPLAELSRRVLRFSGAEELGKTFANNEVELLSDEFQRLDQRLTKAHEDLLERHRYELELDRRLQRADRLATIGTLASGLAHEIGTPMAVIRTRTELLLEGNPNPEKTREGLEIILSQIERITRIVRMLLDYARSRESVRAKHDVRTIIEHVLKLVETEGKRRGVRVVVEPSSRPLSLECDAEQLQQVFINLAVNAFDAMTPNGGTLRVSTEVEQKDHHTPIVKVTFEDNGSGVSPQFQEHLFDPFFTTKPPGKGTGMGLSVSQAIIRDHNGEISFDSEPSSTRFYVRIPMAPGNEAPHINGDARVER
jgi:two-component system, NtrC family, sensor kinase